MLNKIDGCIESNNGNIYLVLVLTDGSKDMLKSMKNYGTEIRDLIRAATNNWDNYDEEYMKIKFNSDDYLPAKEIARLYNMIKATNSVHNFS